MFSWLGWADLSLPVAGRRLFPANKLHREVQALDGLKIIQDVDNHCDNHNNACGDEAPIAVKFLPALRCAGVMVGTHGFWVGWLAADARLMMESEVGAARSLLSGVRRGSRQNRRHRHLRSRRSAEPPTIVRNSPDRGCWRGPPDHPNSTHPSCDPPTNSRTGYPRASRHCRKCCARRTPNNCEW